MRSLHPIQGGVQLTIFGACVARIAAIQGVFQNGSCQDDLYPVQQP